MIGGYSTNNKSFIDPVLIRPVIRHVAVSVVANATLPAPVAASRAGG
jgi:hypothetical protein